jgi:hypothetical protein
VVLEKVLQTNGSRDLVAYAVWEPILRTDNVRSSRKAATLIPDSRVHHYWTGTQAVGELFQPVIELKEEPAWDVYLVYARGVQWTGSRPPAPAFYMHQLVGRLPEDRVLVGDSLAGQISALLK